LVPIKPSVEPRLETDPALFLSGNILGGLGDKVPQRGAFGEAKAQSLDA